MLGPAPSLYVRLPRPPYVSFIDTANAYDDREEKIGEI